MKDILISILRDRTTTRTAYRNAAEKLSTLLALEAAAWLPQEKFDLATPVAPTAGVRLIGQVVLVPVLRAGLALLYPFLHYFPEASVGFVGMKRDEKTWEPCNYYLNLPPMDQKVRVVVLEPMIATGRSGTLTLSLLIEKGVNPTNILFVAIIASSEGLERIQKEHPEVTVIAAQIDPSLSSDKWIVPGLGDFGDRYFGT